MLKPICLSAAALACALTLAAPAQADEQAAALAAINDLGRLNGVALACGYKDTAAWTRILMLNHAPKTRAYGEAYEAGTQESFAAHGKGEPCPDRAGVAERLEQVTQRLRTVLPAKAE